MGQIISLTAITRNGSTIKGGPVATGFDIDDIISPIIGNAPAGFSTFTTRGFKSMPDKDKGAVDQVIWTVQESLATIAGYSQLLLNLTVIRRRANKYNSVNMIFNAHRIQESLVTTATPGVKFMYTEEADPLPVEYEVSNSLASIVAASSTVVNLNARNGATIQSGSFIEWGQTPNQSGNPGALIHNTEIPMAGFYFKFTNGGGGPSATLLYRIGASNPNGAGVIETPPTYSYQPTITDVDGLVGVDNNGQLFNSTVIINKVVQTLNPAGIPPGLSSNTELVNQLKVIIGGVSYYIPCSAASTPLT